METSNKKILILLSDNDLLMARVCKNKFQKEQGWESVITNDYDTALKQIKEFRPNLILTNIILKTTDKTGFDLISEIRSDKTFDDTLIVVFSELGQDTDINKAKSLGANEYYVKNKMTIKEVIDSIKKLVS